MVSITLSPYVIRVKKRGDKSGQPIEDLFGTGTSLNKVIDDVFKKYSKHIYPDKKNKKALTFDGTSLNNSKEDDLSFKSGFAYYGEYGYVRKVIDISSGAVTKTIDSGEAAVYDLMVFYFEDSKITDQAYFVLQTYSLYGCKSLFESMLREEIQSRFSANNAVVDFNPVIATKLVKKLQSAKRVFEISLISHQVPKDSRENLLNQLKKKGLNVDLTRETAITFRASKRTSLFVDPKDIKGIIDWLKQQILNTAETKIYELKEYKFDEISIKAVNKNNRDFSFKVALDEDGQFKEVHYLDPDKCMTSGTIDRDYVVAEAKDYAKFISKSYFEDVK